MREGSLLARQKGFGFSIYYASRKFISAKTRVFVDCVVNGFKSKRLDVAFSANHS
jgi:hypothetical protein